MSQKVAPLKSGRPSLKNLTKDNSPSAKILDESYEENKQLFEKQSYADFVDKEDEKESSGKTKSIKTIEKKSKFDFSKKYDEIMKISSFTTSDLIYDIF